MRAFAPKRPQRKTRCCSWKASNCNAWKSQNHHRVEVSKSSRGSVKSPIFNGFTLSICILHVPKLPGNGAGRSPETKGGTIKGRCVQNVDLLHTNFSKFVASTTRIRPLIVSESETSGSSSAEALVYNQSIASTTRIREITFTSFLTIQQHPDPLWRKLWLITNL